MRGKKIKVPFEKVERSIIRIRGSNVILDEDLAYLYGVPTKVLVQSVKRHRDRFPSDFMFQLTAEEYGLLRSQIVTSSSRSGRGGRRYPPYAFTEQGVAMLSSVLNNSRAVKVNIEIMRTFVRLRRMVLCHGELSSRIDDLERKYDGQFKVVFAAIRRLIAPQECGPRRIGFRSNRK